MSNVTQAADSPWMIGRIKQIFNCYNWKLDLFVFELSAVSLNGCQMFNVTNNV